MLVEKAIGRYRETISALLPPEPSSAAQAHLLPVIKALDLYSLTRSPGDPELLERIGESFHLEKNLAEASRYYALALEAAPPREPSSAEREAMLRYAPILWSTQEEFFPLKDLIALHHPDRPIIAYHLFWEDDYDFPDDCDPCDHEQVWVAYDPDSGQVERVWTFYHSCILTSAQAAAAANRNSGRPDIRVQWGKHGSLPEGWESIHYRSGTVLGDMESTWKEMKAGGRAKDHPIKKRFWPKSYPGTLNDFLTFPCRVDGRKPLEDKGLMLTALCANATIQQVCLPYNFAPKFGWPWDAACYDERGLIDPGGGNA